LKLPTTGSDKPGEQQQQQPKKLPSSPSFGNKSDDKNDTFNREDSFVSEALSTPESKKESKKKVDDNVIKPVRIEFKPSN
jgi:hypothetical protein